MITVKSLSRRYGDFLAVDDVSFEIPRGEAYGPAPSPAEEPYGPAAD